MIIVPLVSIVGCSKSTGASSGRGGSAGIISSAAHAGAAGGGPGRGAWGIITTGLR
jgi:hypothetical protein